MSFIRRHKKPGKAAWSEPEVVEIDRTMLGHAPPGAATWAELHTHQPTGNANIDMLWLDDFSSRIPNINCTCRRDWRTWLEANPPRWSDWFAWTVDAHNAVNARIGKPVLTLNQAAAIWQS